MTEIDTSLPQQEEAPELNAEMTAAIAGMADNYTAHVTATMDHLRQAVAVSDEYGVRAAGRHYGEALESTNAAFMYKPLDENGYDDLGDPILWLTHWHCMLKVMESGYVRMPSPEIRSENEILVHQRFIATSNQQNGRYKDIAAKTLAIARPAIENSTTLSEEAKAICDVVMSDGLAYLQSVEEANEIIGNIHDFLKKQKSGSWVMGELAKSDRAWILETRRLSGPALLELTTELELVPVAA